jgi:hypothetical protein
MYILYQAVLIVHAFVGLCGLVLFWIPIALRKGSPRHKQIGEWFFKAMIFTGGTGFLMATMLYIDPLGSRFPTDAIPADVLAVTEAGARNQAHFFLLLAFLLLTNARHAKLVLLAKKDRSLLRKPINIVLPSALLMVGLFLATVAMQQGSILFGVFAVLGIAVSSNTLHYIFKADIKRAEWVIAHLGAAIGGGIAAHTAFFVFGASRVIGEVFTEQLILIPWIAPGVIGTAAIAFTSIHYRKKYGHYKKIGVAQEGVSAV